MSDIKRTNLDQILNALPGSHLRLALDDELTIVNATDTFYSLIDVDKNKSYKLPNSILKTVYSADIIYYTRQITAQKLRNDNQLLLFFRILQKNGSLKWIMINGNKTEDTYQKQNATVPIYFCMASEVSDHMTEYRKLEQEIDYHRTILELSKELFFEYSIAADILSFSALFREVFGKESEMVEFSKRLEKTKLIHSADLPAVVKTYRSMMSGKKQIRQEFRMITRDGATAWYVCYASIIFDENKNPFKVVGKLAVINTSKEDPKKNTPNIQRDSLTKVYTKDTAENMIVENMSTQDSDALSALFMCEVRNYKGVNGVAQLVDGENVLSFIGEVLKKVFRATDIIGRIGLGDFVVYMKDISSERNAYEKAEYICREVNRLYSYDFNKNRVFISIGVTLVKGKSDYSTSMTNAKAAQAMTKKENSSSFEVFYP